MAVFSTTVLFLVFFVRVNCADDYDDVTTHENDEDDVITQGPTSSPFDDDVKAKFLNVLERKLKTQRGGGGGGGGDEEVAAGGQVAGSEVKRSRSWADNTMFTWGKRGKRSTAPHRRRWSDHSMSSWGRKRSVVASPGSEEEGLREETGGGGGGGGGRPVDDWMLRGNNGEADDDADVEMDEGSPVSHQKRRWSEHSMSVWGKRRNPGPQGAGGDEDDKPVAVDLENEEDAAESDALNQGPTYPALNDKSPSHQQLYFALLHQRYGAPKRNWATNTMNVWGKRLTPQDIRD